MLTGNKGEWSEPYALLKLLADKRLFLGGNNFEKLPEIFYPILKMLRHEKDRVVEFEISGDVVFVKDGIEIVEIPLATFDINSKICFDAIKKGNGSFAISEIEEFLKTFFIKTLKAKSKLKNDISVQIVDPNTFLSPSLGFSVKSQLGRPSTLVNASGATNFTYNILGPNLSLEQVLEINSFEVFSKKLHFLAKLGCSIQFEKVDSPIFSSNLQTVDSRFSEVLSEVVLSYYMNDISANNKISHFIKKVSELNPLGYPLHINSEMYELMMKKFLTDYALGMRAAEVWKRKYEATGGYLIVRSDGEIVCYHFYFTKEFEDYLFANTKLETPDPGRHGYGNVYVENGLQKIKLNLQVRFIK